MALTELQVKQAKADIKDYPLTDEKGLRLFVRATGSKTWQFRYRRPSDDKQDIYTIGVRVALRTMGFTNEEMTAHGFRAMGRTLLDEALSFPPEIIEHQLAHAVKDPLGAAYNRTKHLPQRKDMMQKWGTTWTC